MPSRCTVAHPQTISEIAHVYGVNRAKIRALIAEHGVPTYWIGPSRCVGPEEWPRLREVLGPPRRRRKARARVAVPSARPA